MTVPSLLEEPGRVDEPQAAQEYAAVLTQVVAAGRPVIVRRNGEDLAAVVPLEHLELVREILAHQEVERSAAEIDWTRARRSPAHRNRGSTTRTTTPSSRRRNQRREPVPPAAARQRRLGGAGRPQRLSQGSPGYRRHSHGGHQCREDGARGGDHDPTPQPSAGRLRLAALGSAREGSLGLEAPVCGRRKLAGGNPDRRCATGGRHPAAAGYRRTADEDLGRPAAALGNTSSDTSAWRPGSPAFLGPTGREPSRRRRWSGRG